MDIPNPKKVEIRGKKVVNNGARLVIRRGATEEECEIPLSHPGVIEGNHRRWFPQSARVRKELKKG